MVAARNPVKISARNVFEGHIVSVKEGPINAEVELKLPSGEAMVAAVTEGSVKALGLAAGKAVIAVVKAPLVMLAVETEGWKFSARNRLDGRVLSVVKGAVNASVSLELAGGATLASIVTNGAVDELGLVPGSAVTALFKAGSVVLALEG